jgi:hypothetical protein
MRTSGAGPQVATIAKMVDDANRTKKRGIGFVELLEAK